MRAALVLAFLAAALIIGYLVDRRLVPIKQVKWVYVFGACSILTMVTE